MTVWNSVEWNCNTILSLNMCFRDTYITVQIFTAVQFVLFLSAVFISKEIWSIEVSYQTHEAYSNMHGANINCECSHQGRDIARHKTFDARATILSMWEWNVRLLSTTTPRSLTSLTTGKVLLFSDTLNLIHFCETVSQLYMSNNNMLSIICCLRKTLMQRLVLKLPVVGWNSEQNSSVVPTPWYSVWTPGTSIEPAYIINQTLIP